MAEKHIDADRLKVEIEKHIKEVKDAAQRFTPNMGFFDAKLSGIYDVMAIIDSLRQEQHSEDLEEEIKRYIPRDQCPVPDLMEAVARHFADWQKSQLPMPEDTVLFNKGVAEGRRLERQDMLKDAVKGTVCKDKKCVWIELIPNALPDYEDIEPVKCIVMKED